MLVAAARGRLSGNGDISSENEPRANLAANCIPEDIFSMEANDLERFLEERRRLMAQKIKRYFLSLQSHA